MIIRTPPNQKRKLNSSPISDRRLVVYNDEQPASSFETSDELVCTYQCRQLVKSEFVVALDSAEKQVVEYKSKVESLSNELEKSEEERNSFEESLKYTKQELEATKAREHSLQERLLKEITDSQERYQTQLKKCYELEAQVKKEAESRKNAELAATEAKERATLLEGEIQRLSESTKREKIGLQMELKHLKDDSNLSVSRVTADLEKTKLRADNFQKETELLKDQLKVLQDQLNEETMSEKPTSSHSSCSEIKKVDQNLLGIPVSDNAEKIVTMLGKLIRAHVPISYISWDKVPGIYKDNVWNELVKFYELDPLSKEMFLKRMSEAFRRHKQHLRANYYDTFNNDEERMKNCPPTIAQEDWEEFLKNEATPEASGRRELGKKNRSLLSYAHHAGRKSHAKVEQEMIAASPSTNINRRQVWEKTHTEKDGSISDATSSYFDQIAKAKEKITDSDEEKLTVDENILSQVLGKDARGRSRDVGTVVPKTKVKACAIAQKRIRHVRGEHDEFKMRVGSLEGTVRSLEGTVGNFSRQLEVLINMVGNIEQGIRAPVNSSDGGRTTQFNAPEFVASQFQNSTNVANNQRCEIHNSDLDIIATGTVCRDSTSSKIHGKSVPSTHEKLVLDNILLPDERTSKMNHQFAETFAEVGVGGYVCHPKCIIRYL